MILVFLNVNGKIYVKRCRTLKAANEAPKPWLRAAAKKFPNGTFVPQFYGATRIKKGTKRG